MRQGGKLAEISGQLFAGEAVTPFRVARAASHSLLIELDGEHTLDDGAELDRVVLELGTGTTELGRCRFNLHSEHPRRRSDDPAPEPGDGRLTFTSDVYDFSNLFREGSVGDLARKVQQLVLVWNRKTTIRSSFREFVADLSYDLQVYRALFDTIDRNLEAEPVDTREEVHRLAMESEYSKLERFIDEATRSLERETADFNRQEHERHGFYFRKQLWDMILASAFLRRTNLKPRGYAGDSTMMRFVYDDELVGDTIFAKMMHRYPIRTAAAEAVRNRRLVVPEMIREVRQRLAKDTFRLMSVACGSAAELNEVLASPEDCESLDYLLLDQDAQALAEAGATIAGIEKRHRAKVRARIERDSVRTMLRTARLSDAWGKRDLVYAMGLFDYLTPPVAKAVLTKLWEMVLPGGELVIGNFHPRNPTRTYMEDWADWVLFYRSEEELVDLTEDLGDAEVSTLFEAAGAQMFLRIRKLG